ncbi:hypothetical protein JOF53_001319 [Crossiella equi]|uniref:Uncharacterized protein n=1 Tax=Crossiella equi TaxID=130796 RepID=A0ABS5A778_9PSEU|nr:hypothetical protein [Crossiella equi]MBP2472447.1 hypothetical protein [Crossiella equi]
MSGVGFEAVLVRPDGVVAWAGAPESVEQALTRWFGSGEQA